MRPSTHEKAATPHDAHRYLRLGAISVLASTLMLLAYLLINVPIDQVWDAEQIDDMVMIGAVLFGFYTAKYLYDAARLSKQADLDRRQAEEDALRHWRWFRALVRQMPVGVAVIARADGEVVLTNDQFDLVLKSDKGDGAGFDHRELKICDRSGAAFDLANWPSRRALFDGELTQNEEIQVERQDGSRVWLAVSAAPAEDKVGPASAAIVTFSDITDRKRAEDEQAALMRGVLHAQENERLRIARELHDELGQDLVGLAVSLKALEHLVSGSKERQLIATLRGAVEDMKQHVHDLIAAMRPLMLEHFGLKRALEDMAFAWSDRLGIPVSHTFEGELDDTDADIAIVAYRVAQEAFTNIAKHADATSASIALRATRDGLRLVIEDDGSGFDLGALHQRPARDRFGLAGMAERVSSVGGSFHIDSSRGGGTKINAALPFTIAARAA